MKRRNFLGGAAAGAAAMATLASSFPKPAIAESQPEADGEKHASRTGAEAMITIARYGRTTRSRPQRAVEMTVPCVVTIPTA